MGFIAILLSVTSAVDSVVTEDTDDEANFTTKPEEVTSSVLPLNVASATVDPIFNEDTDDEAEHSITNESRNAKPDGVMSSELAVKSEPFKQETDDEAESSNDGRNLKTKIENESRPRKSNESESESSEHDKKYKQPRKKNKDLSERSFQLTAV